MGMLGGVRAAVTGALKRVMADRAPNADHRACAVEGGRDRFEAAPARAPTTWWAQRPLSEAKNAHSTNTREHFAAALRDGSNWLEGDVRQEINGARLEMRHDKGHESGDNLSLSEWLAMGKASGRGLKLDVKEGSKLSSIVAEVKRAGIPSERLMWNLGDRDMEAWGPRLRKEFPQATLAVNPRGSDGALTSAEVNRMIALAKAGGPPVTFVVRHDRLTDDAISTLKAHGAISVWNAPSRGGLSREDIQDVTRDLRARGVDGVIDLRPSLDAGDKVGIGLDKAKNFVQGLWQKADNLWPF